MAASPSNYTAILAALAAKLTAAGCPNVKDHKLMAHDMAAVVAACANSATVETWMVSRKGFRENALTNVQVTREHTFLIIGIRSCSEAGSTEAAFQARIEAICNTLRADQDVAGTAEFHDRIQGMTITHASFASLLCHYAELEITVHELLSAG
jgi:hypothetical protein